MKKINLIFDNMRSNIYILQNVIISVFLVIIVILIDYVNIININLPEFFLTDISLAKSIISTLAASFLTITTFTFSTIMVVITTYSSDYTPRVVENFLSNKNTMRILGVFVGGFLYTILSLFFLSGEGINDRVVAAFVAVVYSILSVVFFIKFIFSVSFQIQTNTLIMDLYRSSNSVIKEFVNSHKELIRRDEVKFDSFLNKITILSNCNGYLEIINGSKLLNKSFNNSYKIHLLPKIGDYVSVNQPIAEIFFNSEKVEEDLENYVRRVFYFEDKKFTRADYMFSIQKLVEISLRSISPGINDPNTAISCIRIIGVLMGQLSMVSGNYSVLINDSKNIEIVYEDFNFNNDIFYTFYQIVHYARNDISVVIAIFEALKIAKRVSHIDNIIEINNFAEYVFDKVINLFDNKIDKEIIFKEIEYFRD